MTNFREIFDAIEVEASGAPQERGQLEPVQPPPVAERPAPEAEGPPPLPDIAAPPETERLGQPRMGSENIFNSPTAQIERAASIIRALEATDLNPVKMDFLAAQLNIPVEVLRNAPPEAIESVVNQRGIREALSEAIETRQRIIADAEAALVLRGELPAMAASEQALARLGLEIRAPYAQPQLIPQEEAGPVTFGQGMSNAVGRGRNYVLSGANLVIAGKDAQTAADLQSSIADVLVGAFTRPFDEAYARYDSSDSPYLLPPPELQVSYWVDALTGVLWDVPSRMWSRLANSPEDVEEIAQAAARRMQLAITFYNANRNLPLSDAAKSFYDQTEALSEDAGLVDSAAHIVRALVSNADGAAAFFAEVLGEQALPHGAQVAASLLTRRPVVGIGVGTAFTYGQEAYRIPMEMLREDFGIDIVRDPDAAQKLLTNPEALAALEAYGRARGLPIALGQLLSFGIASRVGRGSRSTFRDTLGLGAANFFIDFGSESLAMLGSEGKVIWSESIIEAMAGTVIDTPIDIATTATDLIGARREEAKLRAFLETGQEISSNLRGMDAAAINTAAEVLGDRMAREGIDRVYIDADELARFNQDNPEMEIAETLGIDPEALAEATDEGADIEIDARTFIRHILGREGFEALIEHTRLDPEGPKAGDVDNIDADIEETIEEQLAAAEQKLTANGLDADTMLKLEDDINTITADVADQLRATGRFTEGQVQTLAEVQAKRYAARAVRARVEGANTDALTLYLEDNVRIQGQRPEAVPSFEQAQQGFVDPRIPELGRAAQRRMAGEITQEQYDAEVSRLKPILPYEAVPAPATGAEMRSALTKGQQERVGRGGQFVGQAVGLRLDTPAYTRHDTWVPTIHDQKGKPVAHEAAAKITDVSFTQPGDTAERKAARVGAEGVAKSPFSQINGTLQSVDPVALQAEMEAVLNDPAWTQVGYDPRRHTFFYDRKTQGPVLSADEVIQVGPLVLAKNAVKGEGQAFLFQSAAPLQEQPLVVQGTGPGGRVLNKDLGRVFTERHMAAYGRALDPADPADYDIILDSLMRDYEEQTRQPDSGDAWYTDDINEAVRLSENIYPELANPEFRDLFLTVTALLSPQQKPLANWDNALFALRSWKETGRLELRKPSGKQYGVGSHTTGLQLLQHLIDTKGLENALRWVQEEHTGAEMAEIRRASGLFKEKPRLAMYAPNELNLQSVALGIYMFGPKVGDFMQNSAGIDQNAVTVDLWMARTYNRLIGRLLDTANGDLVAEVRTPAERNHIKRVVRDAAARAGIAPSAMQAALWYFEQRLYRSHAIRADSQNFSDAAAAALKKRGLTDAIGDQQTAGGDAGQSAATGTPRPVAAPGQEPGGAVRGGAVRGGRSFARQEGVSTPPLQPLPGAPKVSGEVFGPIPELVAAAEAYAASVGRDRLNYTRQPVYVQVSPTRGARIAQAYEEAEHTPDDPETKRAYRALIEQTRAQYDALVEAGYEFTFFGNDDDPYNGNPWAAMRDLRDNKTMAVYSTAAGYGTDQEFDASQHMMLQDTGLTWKDQQGNDIRVLANDLFRAVHDAFGHGLEGAGFRARGEENAWQAHVRLFYGEAIKAITTETRGQNSWLNFGPHAETNQTASLEDTVFADQKMAILPAWTWSEGKVGGHGLPLNEDGTLTLTHFSKVEGLTELDPSYHGTGIKGEESAYKHLDAWVDRTYFGVNVGKEGGYRPEFSPGTPMYEARVPADAIYDYQQDPDDLIASVKEQAITHRRANGDHLYDWGKLATLYERAIADAGYEGYFNNATQGLTVAKFTPTPVEGVGRRPEPAPEGGAAALRQSAGGARGGFTPSDMITDQDGNPINLIEIFEKGDVSTFLHESGHFWLEQLKADSGRFGGQFERDWATLRNWWVSRPDEIRAEALDRARRAKDTEAVAAIGKMSDAALLRFIRSGDLRGKGANRWVAIAMHEQFARGTEAYFRNGEAPSVDLVDAFNRFAAWLVSIYRTIRRRTGRDGLDVQFSPQVKQVLDRMLATDTEIEIVAGQYDLASLFDSAEQAGMSPEQFRDHTRRIGRAKGRAKQRLVAKHMKEVERTKKEWWMTERENMREEVERDVANLTPMRLVWSLAQGGLANGATPNVGERVDPINKQALTDLIGKENVELLPMAAGKRIYIAGKGKGSSPGVVATAFGYPDVTAMLTELQGMDDFDTMVDRELDRRMEERHGKLEDDLAGEAVSAVHGGDSAGRLLAAELAALRTTETAVDLKFIKAYARKKLGKTPLKNLRPDKYLAAEKRHAKEAGKAVRKGNKAEAYKQQFQRLVNHYMAKEAQKRRERHTKARDYLAQFKRSRKKFPGIAADYVDKIKVTLDSIDFGPSLSNKKRLRLEMQAINEWVQRKAEEDGAILEVPPLIQQKDALTNWRDMTVDEFETMVDWVKQLETQGRLLNKLRWGKELRDRQEVLANLRERLTNMPTALAVRARDKVASADEMSLLGHGITRLTGLDAALLKSEFLLEQLDGEPLGPWHTAVFQPISQAAAQKGDLMKEVSSMIQKRLEALPKDVRKSLGKQVQVGDLGKPGMKLTRGNLIMLALNMGNESNMDKLIRGYEETGWNINEDLLQGAVAQLTKEEWDLIQSVWDHAEKLWPTVEEIYRRENGRSPERIAPTPMVTEFGTYRGGYFPMFYDSSRGGKAEQVEAGDALEMFQAMHNRAGVNSSMTKERSSQFAAPVNLSIQLLPQAFDRTIHFITHYDAVRSIRRIMSDPELVKQFDQTIGPQYRQLLQGWLGAVAANLMDQPMTNDMQRAVDTLARNTTAAILGFSYTTLAAQLMGHTVAIDRLAADTTYGPLNLARVTADVISGMAKAVSPSQRQAVLDASGEMRHRLGQQDRDLRRMLRQSKGQSGVLPRAREMAGMLIAGLQFYTVDIPVWIAAYNRAMREERGNAPKAVQYADRVVRISQSGGDVKDLAAVQRDKGAMRAFTLFYSFFSVMYGVTKGLIGEVNRNPLSWVRASARILILYTLQEIAMELIRGNDLPDLEPEDEDEAGLIAFAAARTAVAMAQTIPIVRDISGGLISDYGYSATPLEAFGRSVIESVKAGSEAMEKLSAGATVEDFSLNDLKPLVLGVSIGAGIPGGVQVNRTLDGLQGLRDNADGANLFDLLNGYDETQAE